MENRRTIQTILSLETGEQIEVDMLFKEQRKRESEIFQLRTKIEEQIQTETIEYVCIYCKQPIALRGRSNLADKSKHFYFTHLYKSNDCIIKTLSRLTEEQVRCIKYNGEKESVLHDTLKNLIGYYLVSTPEVSSVSIEQVYRDKAISMNWRKPDVLAIYNNKNVAFELQLSTTFLSVIVARTLFYKNRGVSLIWIFPHFSLNLDSQKFTQKDVYYNNNFNVFVFDNDAKVKSKDTKELILKCYYKEYYIVNENILDRWKTDFVKLSQLKFSSTNSNVWFYDSVSEKCKLEVHIERIKQERIEREETENTNQKIERATLFLKEFYKNDIKPRFVDNPFEDIRTENEINVLNNKLKFGNENAFVITKLFFERRKPFFLKFICENDNIHIDTSKLVLEGKTVFFEILNLNNKHYYKILLSYLFRKGYILTENDQEAIEDIYRKNFFNSSDYEKEAIERWAVLTFFSSLKSNILSMDLLKIETILMAIASIKYNLIIGYRFRNLKEVTHSFLTHHKEYGIVYLNAMRVYGQYEQQITQDKTGKLKAKIDKFLIEKPTQKIEYNNVIHEIFPELV